MQRLSVSYELALMAYEFLKIAYWFSCYPLGITIHICILFSSDGTSTDVVKSRIQLRSTPPTGTPVQYIAHELKMIVKESGL